VAGARTTATAQLFGREADAMHALLTKRADELVGCTEGSPEEEELRTLAGRDRSLRGQALAEREGGPEGFRGIAE
jgi:hypothetical protein